MNTTNHAFGTAAADHRLETGTSADRPAGVVRGRSRAVLVTAAIALMAIVAAGCQNIVDPGPPSASWRTDPYNWTEFKNNGCTFVGMHSASQIVTQSYQQPGCKANHKTETRARFFQNQNGTWVAMDCSTLSNKCVNVSYGVPALTASVAKASKGQFSAIVIGDWSCEVCGRYRLAYSQHMLFNGNTLYVRYLTSSGGKR